MKQIGYMLLTIVLIVIQSIYSCNFLYCQIHDSVLISKAEKLDQAYEVRDSILFFNLFPNNHKDFFLIYGYNEEPTKINDDERASPLYRKYWNHIDFLDAVKHTILKSLFYDKVYNIAITGKWDAGAISILQLLIVKLILSDTKDVVGYLSKKDVNDINKFWRFVFDGPLIETPHEPIITKAQSLYDSVNNISSEQGKLLWDQFYKMSNYKLK